MFSRILSGIALVAITGLAPLSSLESKPQAVKATQVAKKAGGWKLTAESDKFSDEKNCRLDAPSQNVLFSFQGKKIYILHKSYIGYETSMLTVRVDQNPATDVSIRLVNGNIGVIEKPDEVVKIVNELRAGTTLRLRLLTSGGLEEDEAALVGFSAAYAKFSQCEGL